VDVDGDGVRDLDPSRIYYYGHSLGSRLRDVDHPFEPAIRAAVFVVPAGTLIYNSLLSPPFGRSSDRCSRAVTVARQRARGIDTIDGREVAAPRFNENLPLRDRPPLVNDVTGALAIQRVVDHIAWGGAGRERGGRRRPLLRADPAVGPRRASVHRPDGALRSRVDQSVDQRDDPRRGFRRPRVSCIATT
jgi:hypothetical protein